MHTRRRFLRSTLAGSSLLALSPTLPEFLANTANAVPNTKDDTILVVVQLNGGNDGINTAIPLQDEGYRKHRRTLAIPKNRVIGISKEVGLHPAMGEIANFAESGDFGIVQGVGYPNPSRSHFESMAVWQSARRDKDKRGDFGWLGRAFDAVARDASPYSVHVGGGDLPVALRGRKSIASGLTRPEDFVLESKTGADAPTNSDPADLAAFLRRQASDAEATAERMQKLLAKGDDNASYPATQLASDLRLVSRLLKANAGTRIFYVEQDGYDTHSAQYGTHQQLLGALSNALAAFWKDMTAAKLRERIAVLVFSEFGRTVRENGSAGTDHGTAAPVFVLGPKLRTPILGKTPSTTDLDPKHGDLRVGIDFRHVYSTVLEDWLGIDPSASVGGKFDRLPIFEARS